MHEQCALSCLLIPRTRLDFLFYNAYPSVEGACTCRWWCKLSVIWLSAYLESSLTHCLHMYAYEVPQHCNSLVFMQSTFVWTTIVWMAAVLYHTSSWFRQLMQLVGGDCFFFLAWNCIAGWIGTHYFLPKYKCIPITSMVNGSLLSD